MRSYETAAGKNVQHGSCGIYGVGSRYQAATDKDTAVLEVFVRAIVN
jgi:hypothetical protein